MNLHLILLSIFIISTLWVGLVPLQPVTCWSAQTPPNHMQGEGHPRTTLLNWEQQEDFPNWNSRTPFEISLQTGLLNEEQLYFTQIRPEPLILFVEDYNPAIAPDEDYIWSDEFSYMGFRINGTESVGVDGFWIYLRGESKGILRYRVYEAEAGSVAETFPDISAPLINWIEVPISPTLQPGQEAWFWLDANETELILDPTSTYANTFYFVIARAYSDDTRIRWVFCNDDANPDYDDEGDAYGYFNPNWYFRTRDLFLNVSILPMNQIFYPSEIDMKVNGEAISDLPSPTTGHWNNAFLTPPPNVTDTIRSFNVEVTWPDFYQWSISFDVEWSASLLDPESSSSEFHIAEDQRTVDWSITIIVDFPIGVDNQELVLPLESDWSVDLVTRNTLSYSNWDVSDKILFIEDAEDGLWQIQCTAPNYVVDIEVRDDFNRLITEANITDSVKICAVIQDSSGANVTNGENFLLIYDPLSNVVMNETGFTNDDPANGEVEIDWHIASSAEMPGLYSIQILWSNGSEAGYNIETLTIVASFPPFILLEMVLFWLVLIILIFTALFISYRQTVLVPKRRIRLENLTALADTYFDIEKIKRILLIHKDSGLSIMDPIVDEKMDANLVGGVIQAVTTLGLSLTDSEDDPIEEATSLLREITYRDLHIIVNDGRYTRNAIIFSSKPSAQWTNRLEQFTGIFEKRFESELENWSGRMDYFKDAIDMVDEFFFITLRLPHILKSDQIRPFSLSNSELEIYKLAQKLSDTQNSFLFKDIIILYHLEHGDQRLELFEAIFKLKEKGIMVPQTTELPLTVSNNNT